MTNPPEFSKISKKDKKPKEKNPLDEAMKQLEEYEEDCKPRTLKDLDCGKC